MGRHARYPQKQFRGATKELVLCDVDLVVIEPHQEWDGDPKPLTKLVLIPEAAAEDCERVVDLRVTL